MDDTGTVVASTPEEVLRRLEWQVIRRLDGLLQGDYRTIFRGVGLDFRDLREYEPGDDVRHIDWNVTARMDTPYVREYSEDREVTAWLLLDRSPDRKSSCSASSRPPSRGCSPVTGTGSGRSSSTTRSRRLSRRGIRVTRCSRWRTSSCGAPRRTARSPTCRGCSRTHSAPSGVGPSSSSRPTSSRHPVGKGRCSS